MIHVMYLAVKEFMFLKLQAILASNKSLFYRPGTDFTGKLAIPIQMIVSGFMTNQSGLMVFKFYLPKS